jgi:hypothetical protein
MRASDLVYDKYLPGQLLAYAQDTLSGAWTTATEDAWVVVGSAGDNLELAYTPPVDALAWVYALCLVKTTAVNAALNAAVYSNAVVKSWAGIDPETASTWYSFFTGNYIELTKDTAYTFDLRVQQDEAGTITVYNEPRMTYLGYMAWAKP